jgi:hypothetical protein
MGADEVPKGLFAGFEGLFGQIGIAVDPVEMGNRPVPRVSGGADDPIFPQGLAIDPVNPLQGRMNPQFEWPAGPEISFDDFRAMGNADTLTV